MDQQLLTGYVLGLIGLFTACLFLLVGALVLRDLIRWLSKAGTAAKQVGNLESSQKRNIGSGTLLPGNPGNQQKTGFGIPSRDEALSQRDQGRNSAERRSDR